MIMIGFEITPITQLVPSYIVYEPREPIRVSFDNGLRFFIADGNWWYMDGPKYDGIESYKEMFDPKHPYTVEEILELSSKEMQDTIIFNIDIFGRIN